MRLLKESDPGLKAERQHAHASEAQRDHECRGERLKLAPEQKRCVNRKRNVRLVGEGTEDESCNHRLALELEQTCGDKECAQHTILSDGERLNRAWKQQRSNHRCPVRRKA